MRALVSGCIAGRPCGIDGTDNGLGLRRDLLALPTVSVASFCPEELLPSGIPVVSQRDARTLGRLRAVLGPSFEADPTAREHHEPEWFVATFGRTRS